MQVRLVEISAANRADLLALSVSPDQLPFVGSVEQALADARAHPDASPWYRAIEADGAVVGFVMLSWNVAPRPPEIIGPWFLWKLIVDKSQQGRGIGRAAVHEVARLVRREGATSLLTSYVDAPGGPAGFYAGLGFRPTGDRDASGEVIVELALQPEVGREG